MKALWIALLMALPAPAIAQTAPACGEPRTILFVGNSFTHGANSAAKRYRADIVTDLNGTGYGGVPALFKTFAEQAGLDWKVSLEAEGGRSLRFHYEQRRAKLVGKWDVVVLQEYSTLDPDHPGDPAAYIKYAGLLAADATRANPKVDVFLMSTWSRADQVRKADGPWSGKPISAMAIDLRAAADRVRRASRSIDGVIPVGEAWNRAMVTGVADADPYDGVSFGQVSLWAYDYYHASIYGSYLEALTVFGRVTGVDPLSFGASERAADDLGISGEQAVQLQRIASEQLAAEREAGG